MRHKLRFHALAFTRVLGGALLASFLSLAPSQRATLAGPPRTGARPIRSGQGALVVIGGNASYKTIRFGDQLDVTVTLQNQGKEPIRISPGALTLKGEGWSGYPGGGSGLGESPLAWVGNDPKQPLVIQIGETVSMTGINTEMAAESLGPMTAHFVIETKDEALKRELGNSEGFSVSYYVEPSPLLLAAWAARTPQQYRQLQPQMRDLLLLGSKADEWRDRNYVEHTLTYLGCCALPLLELTMTDSDPAVRRQAALALSRASSAAANINALIANLTEKKEGGDWAASVATCDENHATAEGVRLALAAVSDGSPEVRIAALSVLTYRAMEESGMRSGLKSFKERNEEMDERTKRYYESLGLIDPALPTVRKIASADGDADVRAAAQKFLSKLADRPEVAENIASSLGDSDAKVQVEALTALRSSQEPPPMAVIQKAFPSAKGEVALGLIELMKEREDPELAARLSPGFRERPAVERLAILTAIAGHTDVAALNLIALGLKGNDPGVQRAAVMRALALPTQTALSLIKTNQGTLLPQVTQTLEAAQRELESRAVFPFLGNGRGAATERIFPSVNGAGPVVSPDGQWVAYLEIGWGRPGGSGGVGRSNLPSLTHVVHPDGGGDRIVSDMFPVGWTADSRGVASARDAFAEVTNLNGKALAEFGDPLDKTDAGDSSKGENWTAGEIREEFGVRMPHTRGFPWPKDPKALGTFDDGEDAAISPDGKWLGPRQVGGQWEFVNANGSKVEIEPPANLPFSYRRFIWSPDGSYVVAIPLDSYQSNDTAPIRPAKAYVLDFAARSVLTGIDVDLGPKMGEWDYRKGRWNPWSRDGRRLVFIRNGQVWTSDADGSHPGQLTFDSSNKAFPVFSPDGSKIAYIVWQFDLRMHYTRLGPTDVWVVDCKSGLAARVTRADQGYIEDLNWLDGDTIIFDRLGPDERTSTLRTVSLNN
jgi:HEAT repeat protein